MMRLAERLNGMSLRQRFLVAPGLGLILLGLLMVAFIYETHDHDMRLTEVVGRNMKAFDRHSAVFVDLSRQHLGLYDLLSNAATTDEDVLYDGAKKHLYAIHEAMVRLEEGVSAPAASDSRDNERFNALLKEVRARTQAYRQAVVSAVELTTVNTQHGPLRFAQANDRFIAMNRAFAQLLELQRKDLAAEIENRIDHSRKETIVFSAAGLALALLLLGLSIFLSRLLSRSLEGQISILGKLGGRTGHVEGTGHEVERIGSAIATFQHAQIELQQSEERYRQLVELSPDAIFTQDEGRIAFVNRACMTLFGAARSDDLVGRRAIDFIHPDHHGLVLTHRRNVYETGRQSPLTEIRILRLDGGVVDVEASGGPFTHEARPGTQVVLRDITERKRAQEHIAYLSQYDTLTGLPNRSLFRDRLDLALTRARRRKEMIGIMLFNLDRFKQVNETLGLDAGDELLRQVAARLKETLRDVDTIARLGGDEFAILVEGVLAAEHVTAVAEKLVRAFAESFTVRGHEIVATSSIGIAVSLDGTGDPKALLQDAESAMQEVKRDGGNGCHLFKDQVRRIKAAPALGGLLRHAVGNGELVLHYQPKLDLATGAIAGAEALVRWKHPALGMVSPAQFIPLAEETGLILPIGEWVLNTACAYARSWQDAGINLGMAVNLSPRQFRHKNLLRVVVDALDASGLDPQHLELEVTETAALSRPERAENILKMLRGLGVRIALDDFGTGHSSLTHLRRLPLDAVKIDRSFVRDIATNVQDRAIVSSVATLGHMLGMRITAEGIEDATQLEAVRQCGCDEYQGYYFSRPLPAAEFSALLARTRNMPGARHEDILAVA